jgi:hypothetical protein
VGLYLGEVDGSFGPVTATATQEFQRRHGLTDDGIAGNHTIGVAMTLGFAVVEDDAPGAESLDWPPPTELTSLRQQGREQLYGQYPFEPVAMEGNPEAIRILSKWPDENLVMVQIPQLVGVKGAPTSGTVPFHRLVAPRVVELFARWEAAGLNGRVLTWGGSFAPRFIRGSRSVLSAHAHGSAFDINVAWNGFGVFPARVGAKGSVRELVPIANELGFLWGGHFSRKKDGMHFELVKL